MIKILTQNGIENTNLDGARDGYFNSGGKDGISSGILNNGTLTAQGNVLTLDTCEMRIKGHRIVIDEPITKTISGFPTVDTNYQFIAKITYNDGNVTFDTEARPTTNLTQDDILNGNGTYEVVIGKFIHKTDGTIANLVQMMRVILGGGGGQDGTTFTPYVDENGVISWTNDGGRENPEPVNIKGATGVGVPAGGTTGQVLKKKSGTDYDTEWGDGGGGVNTYIIKPTELDSNNLPKLSYTQFITAFNKFTAGGQVLLDTSELPSGFVLGNAAKMPLSYIIGDYIHFEVTYYRVSYMLRYWSEDLVNTKCTMLTGLCSPGKWGPAQVGDVFQVTNIDSNMNITAEWKTLKTAGTEAAPFMATKDNDLVTKKYFNDNSTKNYDELSGKPILRENLSATGFVPVENTYYQHTGVTTSEYKYGVIYYYDGTKYRTIDGKYIGKNGTGSSSVIFNADDNSNTNTCEGDYSATIGKDNKNTGYKAFVGGEQCENTMDCTFTYGLGLKNKSSGAVFGQYNNENDSIGQLLVVGAGVSNNERKNVLGVGADNVNINGNLIVEKIINAKQINITDPNYAPLGQNVLTAKYFNDNKVGAKGTGAGAEIFNEYEGDYKNVASGQCSHAEGWGTKASNFCSHAEGSNTTASGDSSHAEGFGTTSSGGCSHVEGTATQAIGDYSHAQGRGTRASGNQAHTEGFYTIANGENQHAQGKYNVEDIENKYAHIVGNGESDTARSNAHTLDWQGNAWYAGKVSGGTEKYPAPVEKPNDYVTKKYFEEMRKGGLPINEGDTLSKLYFDKNVTPDLSEFTYAMDETFGFPVCTLVFAESGADSYTLAAAKVPTSADGSTFVYALAYIDMNKNVTPLYTSGACSFNGVALSAGWQPFSNPLLVSEYSITIVDTISGWNGVWVSKKAFLADTDDLQNVLILTSPNGTKFKIFVTDSGVLNTELVG